MNAMCQVHVMPFGRHIELNTWQSLLYESLKNEIHLLHFHFHHKYINIEMIYT